MNFRASQDVLHCPLLRSMPGRLKISRIRDTTGPASDKLTFICSIQIILRGHLCFVRHCAGDNANMGCESGPPGAP